MHALLEGNSEKKLDKPKIVVSDADRSAADIVARAIEAARQARKAEADAKTESKL